MEDQKATFKRYEDQYCRSATEISRSIDQIRNLSAGQRSAKVRECEALLGDADNLLRRLDMEARSIPAGESDEQVRRVQEYRLDLKKLKDSLATAKASVPSGAAMRMELGLNSNFQSTAGQQRDRMLQATGRMEQSNQRLDQGRQTLLQTEELGVTILQDLQRQRDTIISTRDTLHAADDNIGVARRVLGRMTRRITMNKLVMGGIIVLLAASIIVIIVAKVRK